MKRFLILAAVTVIGAMGCSSPKPAQNIAPPIIPESPKPLVVDSKPAVTESDLGLPFYPGSVEKGKVASVMDTSRDKTVFSDRLTKDDPKKVAAFYIPKLLKGGQAPLDKGILVSGKLKNGATVNMQIMPAGPGQTEIGITAHSNKK